MLYQEHLLKDKNQGFPWQPISGMLITSFHLRNRVKRKISPRVKEEQKQLIKNIFEFYFERVIEVTYM